jgi:hypothetical protein
MRKVLITILLFPLLSYAQNNEPRFENDTLYTSSGYKIFSGQTLEFGAGTKRDGKFRYVTVKNGLLSTTLTGRKLIVKQITNSSTTIMDNEYVDFTGYLIMKDNSREYIILHMAYDYAIENSPVLPSELKVPAEFRNKMKRNIKKELVTARNLYEDKVIKKAEYEEMKQKITNQ